jgi:hypothetical protein
MRKAVLLIGGAVGIGLAIASQRQDAARYMKIKQIDSGRGHPENVPAAGTHRYPGPGQGVPDGTGEFDSAHRGGPAARF